MKKLLILGISIFLFMTVRLPAQNAQVTSVPNLNEQNTSVVNNNFQTIQTGINGVFGLFSQYFTGGILNTTAGGTGKDSHAWASGDVVYMSNAGVWSHEPFPTIPSIFSNVLFQYQGQVDVAGGVSGSGEITTNANLIPAAATANYRFLQIAAAGGGVASYVTIWTSKFIKISGINTVTIYGRIWSRTGAVQANLKVDIGGANGNVSGTSNTHLPEWVHFTINVSGLSNGTAYDVTVGLEDITNNNTICYCSNVIGFGS